MVQFTRGQKAPEAGECCEDTLEWLRSPLIHPVVEGRSRNIPMEKPTIEKELEFRSPLAFVLPMFSYHFSLIHFHPFLVIMEKTFLFFFFFFFFHEFYEGQWFSFSVSEVSTPSKANPSKRTKKETRYLITESLNPIGFLLLRIFQS